VKAERLFSAIAVGLLIFVLSSCELDPWVTGSKNSTDKVVITKITKFGKQKDGVSPMKSQVGGVTMSHKTHEDAGLICENCHHKKNNPDRIKVCARCHVGDNGYERLHGLCVDCHIAKSKGPQKCKECH